MVKSVNTGRGEQSGANSYHQLKDLGLGSPAGDIRACLYLPMSWLFAENSQAQGGQGLHGEGNKIERMAGGRSSCVCISHLGVAV